MLHKRVMGAAGATVAIGALVLAGLQGPAFGSDSPGTPDSAPGQYSPGMLKAMQRDLGLTAAQAERRLANESEAGAVAGALRLSLGRSYGGAWVSGKTSADVVVATTDATEAKRITDEGARAKVVDHSLAELDAAKADLDRVAKRSSPAHVPVWYVDTSANRVVLHTSRPAAAERFADRAGVDDSLLKVVRSDEKPRPYYDIVGGDAYYIGSGGRCSVGFSVTRGSQEGFVTAGHCGRTGQTTSGVNRQPQGTFQGSTFPGRDYAWVGVNSQWNATPTVNGYGTGTKQVEGSTEAIEDAAVCRSGSTTGWHCGRIQQRNTSVTYPQGTVSPVTRTSVCAEPGDSGGSFISGTQAQGMTSGGSGNCTSGGTTYFQPVNAALQVYGLTLTTTDDGGPTDPPTDPPGGTWAAGTVYQAGDTVTYGGTSYRCLQGHQALPGWEPPNVPALWQAV